MEYIIITLPTTTKSAQELINGYAKQGWEIICALADYRLILGREKIEINI